MKISIPFFKGEVPRQSSRLLPDGYAASATNARMVSGDLTAWGQPTAVSTLSPSSILSIFKMQTAASTYLRSTYDVNWVRGAINETTTTERVYFTSFPDNPTTNLVFRPKVTNYSKATGGTTRTGQTTGNYPNDWLILGSPAPTTAPSASSTPTASTTIFANGTSTAGWITSGTVTANVNHAKLDSTTISMTSGSYLYKDHLKGSTDQDAITFEFAIGTITYTDASDTTDPSQFYIKFAVDAAGNGPVITLNTNYTSTRNLGTDPPEIIPHMGSFAFGTSTTTTGTITNTFTKSVDLFTNTGYNCSITMTDNGNGTFNARIVISEITAGTLVIDTTQTYTPTSTYASYRAGGAYTAYIDEIYTGTSGVINHNEDVSTTYVYTFLNEFGEESPPSPATELIVINPGTTTTIYVPDPDSTSITDYGLNNTGYGTKRIYRAATGADGQTSYLFLADIDYGEFYYTDTKLDEDLGEVLESEGWDLPPTDGHSIISLPNGITMMASKNQVYPSVQNRPHAYPADYALSTDFTIIGLGVIDTTVIVLTQANPYIIVGTDPSQLSMAKLELPYGCVSKRSIASLSGFGIIYASPNGLVGINGAGVNLISTEYFTREQWQALTPANIFGYTHDDRYFFYSGTTGYQFDPKNTGTGLFKIDISIVGGFNNAIVAAYSDPVTDILYFVHTLNKLATWNTSVTLLTYTWRSKIYQMPYSFTMECGQIKGSSFGSGVTFKIYADGSSYFTKTVTTDGEFVTPAVSSSSGGKELQIELSGTATISTTEIAESMEELE